jgi:hypothetical protein
MRCGPAPRLPGVQVSRCHPFAEMARRLTAPTQKSGRTFHNACKMLASELPRQFFGKVRVRATMQRPTSVTTCLAVKDRVNEATAELQTEIARERDRWLIELSEWLSRAASPAAVTPREGGTEGRRPRVPTLHAAPWAKWAALHREASTVLSTWGFGECESVAQDLGNALWEASAPVEQTVLHAEGPDRTAKVMVARASRRYWCEIVLHELHLVLRGGVDDSLFHSVLEGVRCQSSRKVTPGSVATVPTVSPQSGHGLSGLPSSWGGGSSLPTQLWIQADSRRFQRWKAIASSCTSLLGWADEPVSEFHLDCDRESLHVWAESRVVRGALPTLMNEEAFLLPDGDDEDEEDSALRDPWGLSCPAGRALRFAATLATHRIVLSRGIHEAFGYRSQLDCSSEQGLVVGSLGLDWCASFARSGVAPPSWRGGDPRSAWFKSLARLMMLSEDVSVTLDVAVALCGANGAEEVSRTITSRDGVRTQLLAGAFPATEAPAAQATLSGPIGHHRALMSAEALLQGGALSFGGGAVSGSLDFAPLRRTTNALLIPWLSQQELLWSYLEGSDLFLADKREAVPKGSSPWFLCCVANDVPVSRPKGSAPSISTDDEGFEKEVHWLSMAASGSWRPLKSSERSHAPASELFHRVLAADQAIDSIAAVWLSQAAREHCDILLAKEDAGVGSSVYCDPQPLKVSPPSPALAPPLTAEGFPPTAKTDPLLPLKPSVSAVWECVSQDVTRECRARGLPPSAALPQPCLPAAHPASAPTPQVASVSQALEALGFSPKCVSSSAWLVPPSDRAQRILRGLLGPVMRIGSLSNARVSASHLAVATTALLHAWAFHSDRHRATLSPTGTMQLSADLLFCRAWLLSGAPVAGRKQTQPGCALECLELAAARFAAQAAGDARASFLDGRCLLTVDAKEWRFLCRSSAGFLAASVPSWTRAQGKLASLTRGWSSVPWLREAMGLPPLASGVSSRGKGAGPKVGIAPVAASSEDHAEGESPMCSIREPNSWGAEVGFADSEPPGWKNKHDASLLSFVRDERAEGRAPLAVLIANWK